MIGYLEGRLLSHEDDRLLVLANQVGYEVLVAPGITADLAGYHPGDIVSLFIYFHQTERQPKPVLIGFHSELDKAFFQLFISVEAIGPLKAVKALTVPVAQVARAIESRDVTALSRLNGIGKRTAQKIIATLEGKMDRFLIGVSDGPSVERASVADVLAAQVEDVLVKQLGHRPADAHQMVADALVRCPDADTPEALFDAVFQGKGNP